MTTQNDGGPAFPTSEIRNGNGDSVVEAGYGMALRDWFAGQALANSAICTGTASEYDLRAWFDGRGGVTRQEIVAAQAHRFAEAMLAERAKAVGT